MKNQYFGDINDFRKYSLLRIFSELYKEILIVWMLTHNDDKNSKNKDGRKIHYLNHPNKYRDNDPILFDELCKLMTNDRNIKLIEQSEIMKSFNFVSEFLSDDIVTRENYFKNVYELSKDNNLVFFDPDNGIEVKSCKYGQKKSSKYIYWNEIKAVWDLNKDILLYQHFIRENHDVYIKRIVESCKNVLPSANVIPIVTTNVLFLYITKNNGKQLEQILKNKWNEEIKVV